MAALRSGLVAIALVASLAGSARAQLFTGGFPGGYPAYPGYGAYMGYYNTNGGFGNYGLPGTFPGYGGFGLPGYGPGANLGGYFAPIQPNLAPRTSNAMGPLINSIRTQTGRGNSYSNGVNSGISRRRLR